jgi:hypothetical protein
MHDMGTDDIRFLIEPQPSRCLPSAFQKAASKVDKPAA